MAKVAMSSCSSLLLVLTGLISCSIRLSSAIEFDVGDDAGWEVPPSNNTSFYNHWASRNRFRLGDTIRFRYRRDSVMEVREEDYESCRSSHPLFFSNTGTTEFELNGGGGQRVFYFISGTAGHCERGQRMAVKVVIAGGAEGPSRSAGKGSGGYAGSRKAESNGADGVTAAAGCFLEMMVSMAAALVIIAFN